MVKVLSSPECRDVKERNATTSSVREEAGRAHPSATDEARQGRAGPGRWTAPGRLAAEPPALRASAILSEGRPADKHASPERTVAPAAPKASWYHAAVMAAPRNYWMVAVRPDYYDVCRDQGFTLLGMGRNQRKRVQRMEIGDRVLFYVMERMIFGATASIAATYVEDPTPLWPSIDPDETFAWRVKIKSDIALDDEHVIDARLLAPTLEYVKKWAPELWHMAFQGPLHLIPKKDFGLIEDEMRRGRPRPIVDLVPDPRHGPAAREAAFSSLSLAPAGAAGQSPAKSHYCGTLARWTI